VIILDEDIIAPEHERLRAWRVHFRAIGYGIGRFGMKDRDQIIPLLHTLRRPTFFTQDEDFYKPKLCHPGYCLVLLDVAPDQVAEFLHRFLRHRTFRTQKQRMGKVVRVRSTRITSWQVGQEDVHITSW
jgi:hypothetical protein